MADDIRIPEPMIPIRWIDTEPVESTDKPCTLSSLDIKARVSGLYADVFETIVIENPNPRPISVSVTLPMPDRATVCGYALDIDGQMIDGVIVPKDKARVTFETEQRRGADPGLVEAVKGNVYQTRVYPVPPHGRRTLALRYVAPLSVTGGTSAFLDLAMPQEHLDKRDIHIDVELLDCPAPVLSGINDARFEELGTCWQVEAHEQDIDTCEPIRVALPVLPQKFAIVEYTEDGTLWFETSEAVPEDETVNVPNINRLIVAWDVSGSRSDLDHAGELALLKSYCIGKEQSFVLVAFGESACDPVTFDNADALISAIEKLHYDGGSDFAALSRVLGAIKSSDDDVCVLFTDGMDTLSGEPIAFETPQHMLAIVSGTQRDSESLRQACRGLAFDINVAPATYDELARTVFCSKLLSGVEGDAVSEILGIGSGADGRFSAIGKMACDVTTVTFANTGTIFPLEATKARKSATISRAWAATRVAQLSPRADDNEEELLELGRRFGVVSPATSLIVLETLDQWIRYDIEPPATWTQMHDMWKSAQAGVMKVSSEAQQKELQRKRLEEEWEQMKKWWEREDYPDTPPQIEDIPVAEGSSEGIFRRAVHRAARAANIVHREQPMRRAIFSAESEPDMAGAMRAEASINYASAGMAAPDAAYSMDMMDMEESVCEAAVELDGDAFSNEPETDPISPQSAVKVQNWMPDAPYLSTLDKAGDNAREAYFEQRAEHATSPSFFIDCAGWFMAHDDASFGKQILTNLAELKIEDAALLRVMAWRLREAGDLDRALSVLRHVLRLRPEDSQSHRDVALVLDELTRRCYEEGNLELARKYAEEAADFYHKIALTPWARRPIAIGLFAVEEYNALCAWAKAMEWKEEPVLEPISDKLTGVLDCDLRITLAWDADETDVDLHVTEPSGEEAYYGHRFTSSGGRVSEDITDGYGPELYEIRRAKPGIYTIRAHYFASHQQTVFGPASCTLTVYSNWGRPDQSKKITSVRLEKAKEMVFVGTAAYGAEAIAEAEGEGKTETPVPVKNISVSELIEIYGPANSDDPEADNGELTWDIGNGRIRVATISEGKLARLVEIMPWGEQLVIVQ